LYRGTMNEQFKKFLKEPVAGSGQVTARYFTG